MLEARLLVKLTEAKTLWSTPPYYTNDAQDVIKDAISMAVDTDWESRIANITADYPKYEWLKRCFFDSHPGATEENIIDGKSEFYWKFSEVCSKSDQEYNDTVIRKLEALIDMICSAIGDKIHHRNLQIADLKREPERMEARIKGATSEIKQLLGDIDSKKLEILQIKERVGRINLTLLR